MEKLKINNKYETIKAIIDGEEYDCIIRFSVSDHILFEKQRNLGYSGKGAIKSSIVKNLVGIETEKREELLANGSTVSDSIVEMYISKVTDGDTIMKKAYDVAEGDCYERFDVALKESTKELLEQLQPKLSELIKPNFHLESMKINIPGYNQNIGQMTKTIAQIVKPMMDTQEMLKPFFNQISELSKSISKYYSSITTTLSDIIKRVRIPSFSEEEKEQIKGSYEEWGKYGWTPIPNASISFYFNPPVDMKDANRKALKYCKNEDMKELFEEMRTKSGIKQSDFEEAIFCFENKKYKSCAMILFALLDSKLIRFQKDEDRNKRNNLRPSGQKAAKNIEKRYDSEEEKNLYRLFEAANIFGCIDKFFEPGNDFKYQPKTINRNFLEHGMLTKQVRRMDCVQLFLLYYNFVKLLEWIKE